MGETYAKRMKINEIIFIRTKILWNASVWVPYIWRTSSVFSVCLEYAYRINHTSECAHKILSMLKKSLCLHSRMPAYATVLETYTTYAYSLVHMCRRVHCLLHTFFCELFGWTANDNSPSTADIPQVYVNQAYMSAFSSVCVKFFTSMLRAKRKSRIRARKAAGNR
jgi:hypothetical protein